MGNYKFNINGKTFEVYVNSINGDSAQVDVNGVSYTVGLETEKAQPDVSFQAEQEVPVQTPGNNPVVKSPLPGVILEISVKEGQKIRKGQKLAVIEAMKMENEIQAQTDGIVAEILVHKGDSVLEGAQIIRLG